MDIAAHHVVAAVLQSVWLRKVAMIVMIALLTVKPGHAGENSCLTISLSTLSDYVSVQYSVNLSSYLCFPITNRNIYDL